MIRSNPTPWWVATLALALIAPGCDSSSGGTGDIPVTQLYESWATTFCDVLTTCATPDDETVIVALLAKADKAACRTFAAHLYESRPADRNIETLAAAGRIVYHADKLGPCLAAARSTCNVDLDELSVCADVFEGTVAAGGVCTLTEECAGDAVCDRSDSDCPGRCAALAGAGAPCAWDGDCSQEGAALACGEAGTCVPLVIVSGTAEGAECGETWGATEVRDLRCAAGLYCDYDFGADASACARYAATGEDCGDTGHKCGAGLVCVAGAGGSRTCGTLPIINTVGGACNETDQAAPLAVCNLLNRLSCVDGACKKLGDGSVGGACAPSFELDGICDSGAYCDEATATCQAKQGAGGPCDDSSACLSGNCDDTSGSGVCTELVCE